METDYINFYRALIRSTSFNRHHDCTASGTSSLLFYDAPVYAIYADSGGPYRRNQPIPEIRPIPRWRRIRNKMKMLRIRLRYSCRWDLTRQFRKHSKFLKKIGKFLVAGALYLFGLFNMAIGMAMFSEACSNNDFLIGIAAILYIIVLGAYYSGLAMAQFGYWREPEPEIEPYVSIFDRPEYQTPRRIRDSEGMTLADDDALGW